MYYWIILINKTAWSYVRVHITCCSNTDKNIEKCIQTYRIIKVAANFSIGAFAATAGALGRAAADVPDVTRTISAAPASMRLTPAHAHFSSLEGKCGKSNREIAAAVIRSVSPRAHDMNGMRLLLVLVLELLWQKFDFACTNCYLLRNQFYAIISIWGRRPDTHFIN